MDREFTPQGRKENLVVQELEKEILIYDLEKNRAFCLNESSALVWQSCDGTRTVAGITDFVGKRLKTQVNEDFVWLALDQLSKENLIENKEEVRNKFAGMSRREAVRKVGLASLIALPVIASLTAPVAAQTGTCSGPTGQGNGAACTRSCQCTSGCCDSSNNRCTNNTGNVCQPF